MSGGVFLVQDSGALVEMRESPYDSEAVLQELLAAYPSLIAGDQINPSEPRQWVLVSREVAVPDALDASGRWSVDHLLIDQDAVPTLVEVKRSTDTRIRRQVVGQMLDYAANAVAYWPVETIRAQFASRCQAQGVDPDQELVGLLGADADTERFWQEVSTNLHAGRVRLVFVADVIPPELQRIIEFLNGQMRLAEVLGVAIQHFSGQGQRVLVPRVIGQTSAAQQAKSSGSASSRQWDEPSFFAEMKAKRGAQEVVVARSILGWAQEQGLRTWWGRGKLNGSFFPMLDWNGQTHWTVAVWTYGTVEVQFSMLRKQPPFDGEALRRELQAKLNSIPGVTITDASLSLRPNIRTAILTNGQALAQFTSALDWIVEQIMNGGERQETEACAESG